MINKILMGLITVLCAISLFLFASLKVKSLSNVKLSSENSGLKHDLATVNESLRLSSEARTRDVATCKAELSRTVEMSNELISVMQSREDTIQESQYVKDRLEEILIETEEVEQEVPESEIDLPSFTPKKPSNFVPLTNEELIFASGIVRGNIAHNIKEEVNEDEIFNDGINPDATKWLLESARDFNAKY